VAVFRAYIDESANTEDTFFIVGGFVAHHTVWESLEPKWLEALPSYLQYFHTTDCFSGKNQFDGIDILDRMKLLDRLTDIVAAHDVGLIVCRLPTKAYKAVAPKRRNEFWVNRYVALFPDVVRIACQYAIGPVSPPTLPSRTEHICHFWWEENEYTASAANFLNTARRDPMLWWKIALGTHTYGTKQDGPGKINLLQVADFGAFFGGKKAMESPQGKISWLPYYEKLEKAGRILQTVIVTEDELKKFYGDHLSGKKTTKT
jgi:hypothetical protein